jgi:peptide/nickel transport system substrate-binding protein
MQRRHLLAAATAACVAPLARPALAQPAGSRILSFVPQAALTSLDTVWGTATVTRNHAFLIFDTLYGLDEALTPRPQMAQGHVVEDDGRRWTITLRPGLQFHDGSKVLARDCVASLNRWMRRDSMGQTLADRLDSLTAPDDRTIVFRLKRRFPALLSALAKLLPSPPIMMPERLALTDPFKQVTEMVGSGPFRFKPDEYVSGSLSVYERFQAYAPRDEAPSLTSGGKRVMVDRVEWRVIPDAATAAGALRTGQVDWWEIPLPDLVPLLKQDGNITVTKLDPYGLWPVLRFNHLQGPTANLAVRQAILAAIDQVEVMQAVIGTDPESYNAPVGVFPPGTTLANDAAMDRLGGPKIDVARIKSMLAEGGYKGERVVLMHPTDQPFYDAMAQVTAATLKRIGINVDDQAMDWGTVVQRRASKEALDRGGWSMFSTSFSALDYADPLTAPALRGNGGAAWYGWPTNARIESLRDTWIETDDPAEQKRLAREMQTEAFTSALYVPLGQYFQSAAYRRNVTGVLKGPLPLFWNVSKI